jgi:cobalamin biosynthesis protein CobD/CbiB
MVFFSVLLVLLMEQARAVPYNNLMFRLVRQSVEKVEDLFHAGDDRQYGAMALLLVLGFWLGLTLLAWQALSAVALPLAWLFTVGLLYLTIGFRQFSQRFTDMQLALNQHDVHRAAAIYMDWRRQTQPDFELSLQGLNSHRLVRMAIEFALVCAYRQVFAVLFYFMLLPGPLGVVLYRIAELALRTWERKSRTMSTDFSWAAQRLLFWLDWLPGRLAALSYAVAGNFEESTVVWRAERDSHPTIETVLVSAGLAAMGERGQGGLGRSTSGAGVGGADAQFNSQDLAVATRLIWRALALWMGFLLLLTVMGPFR